MKQCFSPEFLRRCEAVTQIHKKSNPFSFEKILLKIFEECSEVQTAYNRGDEENMKEELCDVMLAAITMFHEIRASPEEIQDAMEQTLQKVERRCGVLN